MFLLSVLVSFNCLRVPVGTSVHSFSFYDDSVRFYDEFNHCIVTPCTNVYHASPVLPRTRSPRRLPFPPRARRSLLSCLIAFLLITVESNSGPRCVRFGSLNAGGTMSKCALIADLIRYCKLDVLAVCESWVVNYAPDAIKQDFAPPNYSALHVHRPMTSGRRRRGGGLAFIFSNELRVRPLKIS